MGLFMLRLVPTFRPTDRNLHSEHWQQLADSFGINLIYHGSAKKSPLQFIAKESVFIKPLVLRSTSQGITLLYTRKQAYELTENIIDKKAFSKEEPLLEPVKLKPQPPSEERKKPNYISEAFPYYSPSKGPAAETESLKKALNAATMVLQSFTTRVRDMADSITAFPKGGDFSTFIDSLRQLFTLKDTLTTLTKNPDFARQKPTPCKEIKGHAEAFEDAVDIAAGIDQIEAACCDSKKAGPKAAPQWEYKEAPVSEREVAALEKCSDCKKPCEVYRAWRLACGHIFHAKCLDKYPPFVFWLRWFCWWNTQKTFDSAG